MPEVDHRLTQLKNANEEAHRCSSCVWCVNVGDGAARATLDTKSLQFFFDDSTFDIVPSTLL